MTIHGITFLGIFVFLLGFNAIAQDNCVIKLNEAEKLYEAGNIEQIPGLLSSCIENGFNKEDKIQALKLLTLVYLSDDNTLKAEKSLLQLLKADPEYKTNQAIDPVEFIKLFNSFNTAPVFSLGIFGSPSASMPFLTETYSNINFNDANTKYKAKGLSIAMGFKASYHINPYWDISFEPAFSYLSFQVTEKVLSNAQASISETMSYISLPLSGYHYFYRIKNFDFYGEAGFSYDLFLSGSISGTIVYFSGEQSPKEPPEIDTKGLRSDYNVSAVLGAGTRIKLNRSNLHVGLKYCSGLLNQGNPNLNNTITNELLREYQYHDNKFLINKLSFTISYNREFYIHRKKPNNQTNYDVLK